MKRRSVSFMWFGSSERRSSKYLYVLIWFALAVSTRLYRTALAFAPLSDSIMTKFFRPRVNGRMACSAYYPNISIIRFMYRIFLSSSFVKVRIKSGLHSVNVWIIFLLFLIMESPFIHKEVISIETIRNKCWYSYGVP